MLQQIQFSFEKKYSHIKTRLVQADSQQATVEEDASLKAGEGHRPPLPQGQGREADEQRQEGDAGEKFNLASSVLKFFQTCFAEGH